MKILLDTYWGPGGWKLDYDENFVAQPPLIDAADFAYAKSHGLMFDAEHIDRAEALERVQRSVGSLAPARVAMAFAASLSSRRLDLRSALGSYAIGRQIPPHDCSGHEQRPGCCALCGQYEQPPDQLEDLNVLSFERHKWGGVRHSDPVYIGFDLGLFAGQTLDPPAETDLVMLRQILEAASSLPAGARALDLERAIAPLFKSTAQERTILLAILGYCGVLEPEGKPSYFKRFIHKAAIPHPPGAKNDWAYPVAWWRGNDGVNAEAVRFWFGWAGLG